MAATIERQLARGYRWFVVDDDGNAVEGAFSYDAAREWAGRLTVRTKRRHGVSSVDQVRDRRRP